MTKQDSGTISPVASRTRRLALVLAIIGGVLLGAVASASLIVYAGIYNVAADVPHSGSVFWLLKTVRERSIAVRATDVVIPHDLDDQQRLLSGAGQYADMCASCHLAPGMKRTEISRGLYPRAPNLSRGTDLSPAEDFWVIKHGIKMTGMPAWGVTHSDKYLWDIVAFMRLMPELTPEQYQAWIEKAPTHDDMMQQMNGHGPHPNH
jgi:mono/diheme cytochrome c family protein